MKYRLLLLAALVSTALTVSAQNAPVNFNGTIVDAFTRQAIRGEVAVQYKPKEDVNYAVNGFIRDSFTHEDLDSVLLTFMDEDSVPRQSFLSTDHRMGWWQFNDVVAYHPGKSIIRFEKAGYETAYTTMTMHYHRFRKTGGTFGEVLMTRKPRRHEHTLREVTVTATKIKMVMHGDTVVYHADAFELQSGSMLDKLIAMLPGVRLEADGQIFVNGRKVESLLVNGEDFFKGDPKVALDNLPAYMVQDVKVYERTPERLTMTGMTPEDFNRIERQLAIDVILKRRATAPTTTTTPVPLPCASRRSRASPSSATRTMSMATATTTTTATGRTRAMRDGCRYRRSPASPSSTINTSATRWRMT